MHAIDKPGTVIYAGFWIRFLAAFLDTLVLASCVIALLFSIAVMIAITGRDNIVHNSLAASIFYGGLMLMYAAYFIHFEAGMDNATLGKRWLNLKVLDHEGMRLSTNRAAWRLLTHLFSHATLYIGFLIQPFTPRKQALHDLLAGTVVIRADDSKKISIMATLLVLFFMLMVPLLALFSTAGLPVFQQHVQKVQLEKALHVGRQASVAVARFYLNNGRVPAVIGEAGAYINSSPHVSGIDINQNNGELSVNLSDTVRHTIRNKHLLFTPALEADQSISWRCHSNDIEARYLPEPCRS